MKRLITLLLLILAALVPSTAISATTGTDGDDIETWLTKDTSDSDEDDDEIPLTPPRRQRMPAQPVLCVISLETGISLPGLDSSEIYSYEIRDAYGNTVAILADEASFIETLFSLRGEYRLIFRLPGKSISGWISL